MASRPALFLMVFLLLFGIGNNPLGEKIQKDVKVCKNETVTLSCGTDGIKSTYRWRFASRKRIPVHTDKYEQLQNGAKLLVKNIDDSDAHIKYITCHTSSKDMRRVIYIYKLIINCENIQSPVGLSLTLPCKANIPDNEIDYLKWMLVFQNHSKPGKIILTKKDGKITLASSIKFNGRLSTSKAALTIHNIKMGDVGQYQCVAYRNKNFHLSNPKYHYNVNVTTKPTTKPMTDGTTASTYVMKTLVPIQTITLSTTVGYTLSPEKTSAESSTTSQPPITTTATQSTRKMSETRTKSMQISTTSTKATASKHPNTGDGSVLLTRPKSTIVTTWTTLPTSASLANKRPSVDKFSTKAKGILPTTLDNTNSNKTQKLDVTSNRSTGPSLSCWFLVGLCSQMLLSLLADS